MSDMKLQSRISSTLDSVEERLPVVPRKMLQLNRSIVGFGFGLAERATDAVLGSSRSIGKTTSTATKTVAGQARAAAETTTAAAQSGARQVTGQVKAQAQKGSDGGKDDDLGDHVKFPFSL